MKVCWIDVETGGTDPKAHGLIQLAYIIDIMGHETEVGTLYSNCRDKHLMPKALEVNGFTMAQVSTFPEPIQMYTELKRVLAKYVNPYDRDRAAKFVLGGYNAQFDFGFVKQLWDDHNDKYLFSFFNHGIIDPSAMARFLQYAGHPFPGSMKLGELADFMGIVPDGNLHDALTDIRLTRDVTRELIKRYVRARPRLPHAETPTEGNGKPPYPDIPF